MKTGTNVTVIFFLSLLVNLLLVGFLGYKYFRLEPEKDWQDYTTKTTYWQDRVAFFTLLNTRNTQDVFLVGDSMFDRLPLEKLWPNLAVDNRGIGYDNTRALLCRLDQTVIKGHPRKVFLYVGGNDISKRDELKLIITETEQILVLLARHNIAINFVSLLPRGRQYNATHRSLQDINRDIDLFNDAFYRKCPEHNALFIDVRKPFVTGDGYLNARFTSDAIHLNAQGLELLANTLEPYVLE